MEFLRFGSSIPGSYWGCCAMDIIQNFKVDPDAPASISLVNGDGGQPMMGNDGVLFLGPTWYDIFKARLRINTFNTSDKPSHGFLAVLTTSQISGGVGLKWLKILKEEGFEFIRTVSNSVYEGSDVISKGDTVGSDGSANYLFGLFRNIGTGNIKDPYTAPAAWSNLPSVVPEAWELLDAAQKKKLKVETQTYHLKRWKAIGEVKFMTEKELDKKKVTVTYAGQRSKYPQQTREMRKAIEATDKNIATSKADPFAISA